MKYNFCVLIIIFMINCISCSSQKSITFKVNVKSIPDTSDIYITGNHPLLGDWAPDKIKLNKQSDYIWEIRLSFQPGTKLEFKFTRGSWNTEEMDKKGKRSANHSLMVEKDSTLEFKITHWKDTVLKSTKPEINGDFEILKDISYPGLLSRDVWIWLPPGYKKSTNRRYPVLYMHDGQNLFDPNTSFLGKDWQIDETADSLIRHQIIHPLIIVGIGNTSQRREEYSYKRLGVIYKKFFIEKIKPLIDKKYRTSTAAENTVVGGSSRGGLIAFILAWENPDIFSGAICMSPAFKIDTIDYVKKVHQYSGPKKPLKFYIDNGGLDLDIELQPGIDDMLKVLSEKGYFLNKDIYWVRDNKATHNEHAWAKRFWRPLTTFYKK
jgi:predicted alpha/beta superfamily hydrolase